MGKAYKRLKNFKLAKLYKNIAPFSKNKGQFFIVFLYLLCYYKIDIIYMMYVLTVYSKTKTLSQSEL